MVGRVRVRRVRKVRVRVRKVISSTYIILFGFSSHASITNRSLADLPFIWRIKKFNVLFLLLTNNKNIIIL